MDQTIGEHGGVIGTGLRHKAFDGQCPRRCQRTDLPGHPLIEVFVTLEVRQCRLQQGLLLYWSVTAQIKQAVTVDVHCPALALMALQGLLQARLGKLGDALQMPERQSQRLIGGATAQLAGQQGLDLP